MGKRKSLAAAIYTNNFAYSYKTELRLKPEFLKSWPLYLEQNRASRESENSVINSREHTVTLL